MHTPPQVHECLCGKPLISVSQEADLHIPVRPNELPQMASVWVDHISVEAKLILYFVCNGTKEPCILTLNNIIS